jgi:hypothetical protein
MTLSLTQSIVPVSFLDGYAPALSTGGMSGQKQFLLAPIPSRLAFEFSQHSLIRASDKIDGVQETVDAKQKHQQNEGYQHIYSNFH